MGSVEPNDYEPNSNAKKCPSWRARKPNPLRVVRIRWKRILHRALKISKCFRDPLAVGCKAVHISPLDSQILRPDRCDEEGGDFPAVAVCDTPDPIPGLVMQLGVPDYADQQVPVY